MIKLTYIHHSCYLVETEKANLVFDYWVDPEGADGPFPRFLDALDSQKPLYVVVSHHHKDHFTRDIFRWGERFVNARFIISRDTARSINYLLRPGGNYKGPRPDQSCIAILSPGEVFRDSNVTVRAFGSTDIGNSYLVEAGERTLFHAGDLNAWIWIDESTKAEVAAAIRSFAAILDNVRETCDGKLDAAMFPVDSRIGPRYWTGAQMFCEAIETRLFLAMHYGLGDEEEQTLRRRDASRFADYAKTGVYAAPVSRSSFGL